MAPLLVDICRLTDGRWIVRRYHPRGNIADLQISDVVLPVEICAGEWVVSGWPVSRFVSIFGFVPDDASPTQFVRIASYLRFLQINGCLPLIDRDESDCVVVASEHARWFDSLIDLKTESCTASDEYLRDKIERAPDTSLAGILRQHGQADMAFRFLRHCPQQVHFGTPLPLAFAPLYICARVSSDGQASFQFLSEADAYYGHSRSWPFVCTHQKIHINTEGAVRITDVAIPDAILPMEIAQYLRAADHSGQLQPVETPRAQGLRVGRELEEFRELREFPLALRRLVSGLYAASWEHMVESGNVDPRQPREKLRGPVLDILHIHTRPVIRHMRAILRLRST